MKRYLTILLLLLSGSLQATPSMTRSYAYRYFSTRDGLAQMQVMCVFQDKDGYMWFGTKGGVSRWDGESFKNYTQDEGVPILGNILSINEWDNKIVIYTPYSIIFIYHTNYIKVIPLPEGYKSGSNISVPLDEDHLMLPSVVNLRSEPQGALIYDKRKNRFFIDHKFKDFVVNASHDTLFCNNAIYTFKGSKIKKIVDLPDKTPNKTIWCEGNRLYMSLQLYGELREYKFSSNKLQLIKTNKLWNSGFKNAYIFHNRLIITGGVLRLFPPDSIGLGSDITDPNCTLLDREHNLWIGSDNGLYNFFGLNIIEHKFGLSNPDNIWSIIEDQKHNMWLGAYQLGLWKLSPKGDLTRLPTYKSSQIQHMGSCAAPNGDLYLTYANGVASYSKGKLKQLSNSGASLFAYYDKLTKSVYYSGSDSVTHLKGLYVNLDTKKHFYPWSLGYPISIIRDANGKIRVGAWRGQATLLGDSLLVDKTRKEYESVVCMVLDSKHRLWKGTNRGIFVEMPDGSEQRVAGKRMGNIVTSMTIWRNKYLVTGTHRSIVIVPLNQSKPWSDYDFTEIGHDAGFTGYESGQNGICVDHEDNVWLGTAVNVLKFNPENLMRWKHPQLPIPRIAGIAYSKDNINWKQHFMDVESANIQIKPGYKFFRIEYIANSLSSPKLLRFRYRLLGLNNQWSEIIYQKTVNYTNLLPGNYRFQLQCSLDGAHWSKIVSTPEFQVEAPLLLHWYMILLYFFLLIALVASITLRAIRRKERMQREILNRQKLENELQLKTLRSKVIPHFTKNVLSAIGHFAMTDKLKAGHYIAVFSKFTQLTLSNADRNYVTLGDEIEYMFTYLELEKMRFGQRFDYRIDISKTVDRHILIPSMTLHTYCDNAIRHGLVHKSGTGLLEVSIQKKDNGIHIIVKDNGIGRLKAQELGTKGNGQGLSLIQQQLDFYNQENKNPIIQTITDLYDNYRNPGGTSIALFIPAGYNFESLTNEPNPTQK